MVLLNRDKNAKVRIVKFNHEQILVSLPSETSISLTHRAMTLTHKQKEKATEPVKRHDKDTGSSEYQIALFTEQIKRLTTHLKKNKKDFHSRRGLLKMVSKRKKLMNYLKQTNEKSYKTVVKSLGLK